MSNCWPRIWILWSLRKLIHKGGRKHSKQNLIGGSKISSQNKPLPHQPNIFLCSPWSPSVQPVMRKWGLLDRSITVLTAILSVLTVSRCLTASLIIIVFTTVGPCTPAGPSPWSRWSGRYLVSCSCFEKEFNNKIYKKKLPKRNCTKKC